MKVEIAALAVFLVVVPNAVGQCGGNVPGVRLLTDPWVAGTTARVFVEGPAGHAFAIAASSSLVPTAIPGVGVICTDPSAPGFGIITSGVLSPGVPALSVGIPAALSGLSFSGAMQAAVLGGAAPSGVAITPAISLQFMAPAAFTVQPSLSVGRAFGSGNAMGDGRILLAGGGSGSVGAPAGTAVVDIFDPRTRSMAAGPPLGTPRALHTGTTLDDGRVLLCGGVVGASVAVTATCEIFDPRSGVWSPAAPMTTPRGAHAAIRLINGDVLVVGGTSTSASGSTALAAVLGGALNTAEIYSPAANTWMPISSTMSSRRFMPALATLPSGDILVVSGLSGTTLGGLIPTATSKCDVLHLGTLTFAPTANLPSAQLLVPAGVAGAGCSPLPDGRVWVVGGVAAPVWGPIATANTWLYDPNTHLWTPGPILPSDAALPNVVRLRDGRVFVCGGIGGSIVGGGSASWLPPPTTVTSALTFDGSTVVSHAPMPAGAGACAIVLQDDGLVFVGGGFDASTAAVQACFLATP